MITSLLTEKWMRKKKDWEKYEYMFHKVSYKWFRRIQYITSIGLIYKNVGRFVTVCLTLRNY